MGSGADILIIPFVAMLLFAWLAVFVAFFNRRPAKWLVGFAASIFSLIALLVMIENRGHFFFALETLFGYYPICLFTYATLAMSWIALKAPLRYPDVTDLQSRTTQGKPRWRWFFLLLSLTVATVGYGFWFVIDWHQGEAKTIALLAGNETVKIRSLEIRAQQRKVICTDPEVLRYLEQQFRNHEPHPDFGGTSYHLRVRYEGGGSDELSTYWPNENKFCLFVGEPGEGGKPHGIHFPKPRPKGIDEIKAFLSATIKDVAGQVLILESGKSRIENNPSLIEK